MRKPLIAGEEISRKYKNANFRPGRPKHQEKGAASRAPTEVEMNKQPVKDIGKNPELEKALKPYSDNLPYDLNRVIDETIFLLKHEIRAKFEIGKRLFLLKEKETCPKFGQVLENYFPGLSRQRAYEYMLFSQKIINLPKLQEFADGKKNWTKALALLESFDEDELKALDSGESIAGHTLDQFDTMTLKELKTALRKEKKKHEKETAALKGDIEHLEEEKTEIKEKLDTARAGVRTPEQYLQMYKKADKHITEAVKIIKALPVDLLKEDFELMVAVNQHLITLETMVNNLTMHVRGAMMDEGE